MALEGNRDERQTECLAAKARRGVPVSSCAAAAAALERYRDHGFLLSYVGKFDLYVEDRCPAYVRFCFEEPVDATIFRSRFERKSEPFRLAG